MQLARTSATHPLHIATLPVGNHGGAVGVTFAPGKHQNDPASGIPWQRGLDADLHTIVKWGASDLITLLEPHEFAQLKIEALPERARAMGLKWHGLPIADGHAPSAAFLKAWADLGPAFARDLAAGHRIIVHCKGGLGRAGTVACMLLIDAEAARTGADAIAQVRRERPGAIETPEQEAFLRTYALRSSMP